MSREHHTIRNNRFDIKYVNETPIYIDENGIEHSLNKNRNWELLDDHNIKQIKYHKHVMDKPTTTALTTEQGPHTGGGLASCEYKIGRNHVTVNGNKQNEQYDMNDEKEYIKLPFNKKEYPINRESHKYPNKACPCCFQNHGRIWQLKGTGDKAKKKNKGMLRERQRERNYGRDY